MPQPLKSKFVFGARPDVLRSVASVTSISARRTAAGDCADAGSAAKIVSAATTAASCTEAGIIIMKSIFLRSSILAVGRGERRSSSGQSKDLGGAIGCQERGFEMSGCARECGASDVRRGPRAGMSVTHGSPVTLGLETPGRVSP